jgi:hypothetical protein
MRLVAPLSACLFAGAVWLVAPPLSEASPLPPAGLHQGALQDGTLHLARRGFRGGGARAFRGGGGRVWRGGGGRAFAFRGGRGWAGGRAWRGGRVWRSGGGRAFAFRGGGRVWRGARGGRAFAFRAGPGVWRGGRRVWRGGRWVWVGVPAFYGSCPLVRRTVWTSYGWRVRWVRRCW